MQTDASVVADESRKRFSGINVPSSIILSPEATWTRASIREIKIRQADMHYRARLASKTEDGSWTIQRAKPSLGSVIIPSYKGIGAEASEAFKFIQERVEEKNQEFQKQGSELMLRADQPLSELNGRRKIEEFTTATLALEQAVARAASAPESGLGSLSDRIGDNCYFALCGGQTFREGFPDLVSEAGTLDWRTYESQLSQAVLDGYPQSRIAPVKNDPSSSSAVSQAGHY
ncbi:uncharacterized protein IL334_002176 [Kwoniella shivajii]|uniref:Uncharacterized protein n=1 Tax=Kwoniella shivajii TaxID=564305 RepID=A0ABZ1CUM2_9TREE|nr:hypothetical protein IL334_002176 [Kwoniella shivajii]